MSAAAASDWANLLPELLDAIARRVGEDDGNRDRAAFAAVCRPWRRASSAASARLNRHSLHLVSLRPGSSAVDFSSRHGDVVKTAYLGTDADAGAGGSVRPHRVIGCSRGWLVVVDRACGVSLLEPVVDGRRLPLPSATSFDCGFRTTLAGDDGGFSVDHHAYRSHIRGSRKKVSPSPPETVTIQAMRDDFFHKAGLAATGSHPESFTVMVIHSGGSGLAFARPGDRSWTSVRTSASTRYADVIHHNGAFYTLTRGDGSIEAWEPDPGSRRAMLKPRLVTGPVMTWEFKRCVEFHSETFRQPAYYEGARYLAERDEDHRGGLLVVSTVAIFDDGNALRTRRFKVFGVDEREGEWRALQDVGEEAALLVGINHGRRVSTREYPCLKPNCVYYVLRSFAPEFEAMDGDEHSGEECSRYESGVYDLRSGVASRKSVFRRAGGGHPVWFVPPASGRGCSPQVTTDTTSCASTAQ